MKQGDKFNSVRTIPLLKFNIEIILYQMFFNFGI